MGGATDKPTHKVDNLALGPNEYHIVCAAALSCAGEGPLDWRAEVHSEVCYPDPCGEEEAHMRVKGAGRGPESAYSMTQRREGRAAGRGYASASPARESRPGREVLRPRHEATRRPGGRPPGWRQDPKVGGRVALFSPPGESLPPSRSRRPSSAKEFRAVRFLREGAGERLGRRGGKRRSGSSSLGHGQRPRIERDLVQSCPIFGPAYHM